MVTQATLIVGVDIAKKVQWARFCDYMGAERETLIDNKYAHCDEYYKLKEDVRTMEVIRRGAESLMREALPERTPTRAWEHSW